MVHLFGVATGAYEIDVFGRRRELFVPPSDRLQEYLISFPRDTKVGFEWLQPHQSAFIRGDLDGLVAGIPEELYSKDGDYPSVSIDTHDRYWLYLTTLSERIGKHQPVFLEDTDTWLRYNRALVESVKQEMRRDKLLFHHYDESQIAYHRKLVGLNEAVHKAQIRARKIHEIDREDKLLETIATTGVDVAVVGLGHSAYWIATRDAIKRKWGINFDSYCADVPDYRTGEVKFQIEPSNPELVLERTLLERASNLVETGRLVPDKRPAYVGIWDIPMPSTGYFEVFVDNQSGNEISGTIEDPLGSAVFNGTVLPDEVVFTKRYTLADPDAVKGDIVYRGNKIGRDFVGKYRAKGFATGFSGPFLMSELLVSPEFLSIHWEYKADHVRVPTEK